MKLLIPLSRKVTLLPVVLGLCDGLLTTLVLAAGRLTKAGQPITLSLAFRIAAVTFLSGAFVFFVARYAELRGELRHAERQLTLGSNGHLATGALGRAVRKEAMLAATVSSSAAFLGALIPLLSAALTPNVRWTSVLVTLAALALMGLGVARSVHGKPTSWIAGLVLGGVLMTVLGVLLRVVV